MSDKNDTQDFFEKQLDRVNYWLSFAEAKNAALIAFNFAVITLVCSFFDSHPVFCSFIIIMLLISSAIGLYSFVPVDKTQEENKGNCTEDANLLFWKDIAKINNAVQYVDCVQKRYFPNITTEMISCNHITDLANEIVVNSAIAQKKYSCFRTAAHIDLLALIICIALVIAA